MTHAHIDHAEIVALRDGARIGLENGAEAHVAACDACQSALERARERADTISRALTSLDQAFDLEAARAAVRWRVARATVEQRKARVDVLAPARHLARAAGVLLVLAGAAAALPGSPIRSWLVGDAETPPAPATAPEAAATTATPEAAPRQPERTQVRVASGDGAVVVALDGVAAGSVVEVRWVGGSSLAVTAPAGTAFSSAVGRIRALVAAGDVRVDIPRGAARSTLEVDGTSFLTRTPDGLDVRGPVEARTEALVRFRMPGG